MKPNSKSVQRTTETISDVVSTAIPTCTPDDTFDSITRLLTEHSWSAMDYVFVLDKNKKLLGMINMATTTRADGNSKARNLMEAIPATMKPNDKRQKALVMAVKYDLDIIPVVDSKNKFLGALISKTIIDLMHTEHLENVLLTSGIVAKKHKTLTITTAGLLEVIGYRLPWLILGLLAGLGLGLISSKFEEQLQQNIAIAYFIPVIAYIADSVGTQSEAIAVRSLATLKINSILYLTRELFIGTLLGTVIGLLGSLGAFVISGQPRIGVVVGLALFMASTIAAVIASLIPIIFKALGKDPALGSGPLATAIQDIISIVIYFIFVSLVL